MSGDLRVDDGLAMYKFQSRYRAASHFRLDLQAEEAMIGVSISLSSGFSFQVKEKTRGWNRASSSFNLVIERLLISGLAPRNSGKSTCLGFNLVIERLLISGEG